MVESYPPERDPEGRLIRRPTPPRRTSTSRTGQGSSARDQSSNQPGAQSGANGSQQPPSFAPKRKSAFTEANRSRPQPPRGANGSSRPPSFAPGGETPHAPQQRPPQQHVGMRVPSKSATETPHEALREQPPTRTSRRKRVIATSLVIVLLLIIAWPVCLLIYANSKLNHIDALSGAADTPGTTYLIAGSDSRDGLNWHVDPADAGSKRTDTIMLLHVPESGTSSLISLPRDTYMSDIGGHGAGKLNSAFARGGAPLLVQSVESLTGLTIDHYVEVGFGGVINIVDAVGTVNVCLDKAANDPKSGLNLPAGCSDVKGDQALAFVRARHISAAQDIDRMNRQRQFVGALMKKVTEPSLLLNPFSQVRLVDAGTAALLVDESSNIINVGKLALGFRNATSDGFVGTPPIADPGYRPGGVGSTVLLEDSPSFWTSVTEGTVSPSGSS